MTSASPDGRDENLVDRLLDEIGDSQFSEWHREQERVQSIRQGNQPTTNSPPSLPPERHAPSRLLQCHRKTVYQVEKAPKETREPTGVFWVSSRLETELLVPFLRDCVGSGEYVQNSRWVDVTISSGSGELRIRGETDPVIVDDDGRPLLLTEFKTTTAVESLDAPRPRHVAQVHAYMQGLSDDEESDQEVRAAILIYLDRDTLRLQAFAVPFDDGYWESRVLSWAIQNTEYRRREELPPGRPEFGWECDYCAFEHRCGRAETPFTDYPPQGLLPLFDEYHRGRVRDYLRTREDAKLTPTLAHTFPDLVDRYGVLNWHCQRCSKTYEYDAVDWDGDTENPPLCEVCCSDGVPAPLSGPQPEGQHQPSTERTD